MVLNRVWFSREPREPINVFVFSTPNEKPVEKEKYPKYIIRAEFYQFLTSSTDAKLNYDTTKVRKPGMDFRGQVWKRVWKTEYFGLKLGQDFANRAAHPYQEFRGVPPPPSPLTIQIKANKHQVPV